MDVKKYDAWGHLQLLNSYLQDKSCEKMSSSDITGNTKYKDTTVLEKHVLSSTKNNHKASNK